MCLCSVVTGESQREGRLPGALYCHIVGEAVQSQAFTLCPYHKLIQNHVYLPEKSTTAAAHALIAACSILLSVLIYNGKWLFTDVCRMHSLNSSPASSEGLD